MTDNLTQAALATWAAKDLPARLLAEQVAKLLNCSTDDVAILVSAGKLRALGKPRPNAVKFFSSVGLLQQLWFLMRLIVLRKFAKRFMRGLSRSPDYCHC
jgi:hypothetical protein